MSALEKKQYWVRNAQGRVWGPYSPDALDRLRGQLTPQWDVSVDGKEFKAGKEFPELAELLAAPRRVTPPLARQPAAQSAEEERAADRAHARAAIEADRARRAGAATPPAPPVAAAEPAVQAPPERAATSQPVMAALQELELPEEGSLEQLSPVRLYALAAATSATGWLQLSSESGRMLQIGFRRGTPEHLESDDPDHSLLRHLVSRGTLTAAQGHTAEEHAQKQGGDVVTSLFQLQLIPPAEAHKLLGEHMASLLDRALLMWRGRFSFERDAPAPPGAFPLGQRWTLLAEAVRRLDPAPLRARLGRRLTRPVQRSGGLGVGRVEELALTAQESRLYTAIDGVRTADELLKTQDPAITLRLLYMLTELGHLAFADDGSLAPPVGSRPASAPPPAVMAAAAPAMDEPITTPSQGVARVARTRPPDPVRGPPPVVGQVAYTAPPAAAPPSAPAPPSQPAAAMPPPRPAVAPKPAASKPPSVVSKPPPSRPAPPAPVRSNPPAPAPVAARPAAPAKPPAPGSLSALLRSRENEAEAAQAVRLQEALTRSEESTHFELLGLDRKATGAEVKKAFFVLARELHPDTVSSGHAALRSVKERLFSKINEASQVLSDEKRRIEYEEELDGKANNVDIARIFAAEEAFQKGEIMIKARKYEAGLKLVEEAITLNDQEAEFYAWRGWARFLLAKDRRTQRDDSVGDCKRAIAMVPVCLPAWLFLANMAKTLGEPEAEKYYKKVVELDPKHVEALRELRLMGAVKK